MLKLHLLARTPTTSSFSKRFQGDSVRIFIRTFFYPETNDLPAIVFLRLHQSKTELSPFRPSAEASEPMLEYHSVEDARTRASIA
ncbi:hypothetical protein HYPP_00137 [Hyphomicrobium sp. ghe19]|nr:hypothetical protein HYPP_00137 [Hyphomicrobium sp. ghe19]